MKSKLYLYYIIISLYTLIKYKYLKKFNNIQKLAFL